jgi:hypothetical protein
MSEVSVPVSTPIVETKPPMSEHKEPQEPKAKRQCTSRQLEQLAAAREKRKQKKASQPRSSSRSNESADDFMKKLEQAEPRAVSSRGSGGGSHKRKRQGASGVSFGSPSDFAIGAVAMVGLGAYAWYQKKKGVIPSSGSNTASKPLQSNPASAPEAGMFNSSDLFL